MLSIKVSVTGFYGTGSSAVLELLKEYKDAHAVPETGCPYEHATFYVPGGLYDLVTLLSVGNSPLQSDYVMNNFVSKMHQLNDYNYLWFGSFNTLTGNKFMEIVDEFVNSISENRKGTNYNHVVKTRFSPFKALLQFGAHLIFKKSFGKYGVGYVYDNNPVYYANPSPEELYKEVQKFTNNYFKLFEAKDSQLDIYDHLIWPQQVDSHAACFNSDFKIIVVDRDPRDVYISDQFIWSRPPMGRGVPHFSKDPNVFIREWKRTVLNKFKNPNVLSIHFEDLVYNYENTVKRIENHLGIASNLHVVPKKYFDPAKSIENTQVFTLNPTWRKVADKIKSSLPELVYNFPEERIPNKKNIFL